MNPWKNHQIWRGEWNSLAADSPSLRAGTRFCARSQSHEERGQLALSIHVMRYFLSRGRSTQPVSFNFTCINHNGKFNRSSFLGNPQHNKWLKQAPRASQIPNQQQQRFLVPNKHAWSRLIRNQHPTHYTKSSQQLCCKPNLLMCLHPQSKNSALHHQCQHSKF